MNRGRVVITGMGVVSSIGMGVKAFWESLIQGKSGISEITSFDTSKYLVHRGGEVKGFNPDQFIMKERVRHYGRASQFAIAAAKMAVQDSNIDLSRHDSARIAVVIGTTMAEAQAIEAADLAWVEQGEDAIPARLALQYPGNVISANVAYELGCAGPNLVISTACAAGNYAIAYGYDLLRLNKADIVIAGGSDAFSRIAFTGFSRLFAVAPEKCQPFDRNRKGMMVGEGAGIVLLQYIDQIHGPNDQGYAEILGYGISCDANHMTIPGIEGVGNVMLNALRWAGLQAADVGYISAHGTGTQANDKTEAGAIRAVFSQHASSIPVSSIKSMLGHTMGAASALEAIACAQAIASGVVPPTINFETHDPECDIDCVPNVSRPWKSKYVLNNSFAFGGNNACVVLGPV